MSIRSGQVVSLLKNAFLFNPPIWKTSIAGDTQSSSSLSEKMSEEQQNQPESHEDDQSQVRRKKLIVIGSVVAVVVILLIVILILVLILGKSSCKPVDLRPRIDLTKIEAIPSQNNQALVRFAGYLTLTQKDPDNYDTTKYLEIKPRKVYHFYQHDGTICVRLHSDCAIIDIRVLKVYYSAHIPEFSFLDFTVRPTESARFGACSEVPSDIEFESNQYYTCHEKWSLSCASSHRIRDTSTVSKSNKTLETNEINVLMLDLELEGDPDSIKRGKFDLSPKHC